MPKSNLKTISNSLLVKTIVTMKEDYGLWDQDPAVFPSTRKDFNALGNKMTRGVREVMRRVDEDGLDAHGALKGIFDAVVRLSNKDRRDASEVYEALRDLQIKKEERPRCAF